MPKQRIDGTHSAVKIPSSRCPENQRKADRAKEMETAKRKKISDCLITLLLQVVVGKNSL
jgi:hypothetical protein